MGIPKTIVTRVAGTSIAMITPVSAASRLNIFIHLHCSLCIGHQGYSVSVIL